MRQREAARWRARVAMCAALAATSWAGMAAGQTAWRPDKPVEIVVPTGAGGNNDKMARLIQRILQDQKLVSVPLLVMNRPGGNQYLGFVYLNQRAGDAHYFIYSTPTIFSNELNGVTSQRYTEWTALALLVVENTVLTVSAASPLKNVRDLMQRLKADPESLSFAMPARGGVPHLTLASAVRAGGADARKLKIVVFKTNGESVTALAGGHVDVMVSSVSSALGVVKAGNARMLGLAAPQRMRGYASSVPTLKEEGIDSVGVTAWRGVFGPKGLTAPQIAFWDDAFAKLVDSVEWKKQLEENDLDSRYLRSRDFARYLDGEYAATRTVMTELGILK
jgi:putative tricarboxylic transport membrane protein